jgi:hypothetical protein
MERPVSIAVAARWCRGLRDWLAGLGELMRADVPASVGDVHLHRERGALVEAEHLQLRA